LICGFIDQMRTRNYRVESIGRVLTEHGAPTAPRTYRNSKALEDVEYATKDWVDW
jgi:hypothetical protein